MWIELHDTARDHPKVTDLADALAIKPVLALGHLCSLWTWTLRFAPDGCLSSFKTSSIERGAQWEGEPGVFVSSAITVGLLEETDNGLTIHDWDDFSGSLKAAERARDSRKRKRALQSYTRAHACEEVRDGAQTDRPTDQTDQNSAASKKAMLAADTSPPVLAIPHVKPHGEMPIGQSKVDEWSKTYPGVDVVSTLREARQWCVDNPKKQKTRAGVMSFLNRWLSNEQNRGGLRSPSRSRTPADDDAWKTSPGASAWQKGPTFAADYDPEEEARQTQIANDEMDRAAGRIAQ